MGKKGVAHNAAEVDSSSEHQDDVQDHKVSEGQKGGARKTRKGGRKSRRGGRKSRKGGRKSRKNVGGCEPGVDCFTTGGRKKRRTKKKRKGKKRKLNPFFKLMLAAKKAGKASFKYGSKLYKGKKHPRLGMIYKKA